MNTRYRFVTVCAILMVSVLLLACDNLTDVRKTCESSDITTWFGLLVYVYLCPNPIVTSAVCRTMARNNAMILNLQPQGDIQVKSGNAKYKYKGATADQAQQKWKMKGECDTQVESFSEFTLMRINLGVGHDGTAQAPNQVTHTFTPNKVSRNGKRFKTRFQYYPDTREERSKGGHHWPAFGKCFGKIGKDGKLRIWYGVWKAQEGGMMAMDGFDEIKAGTSQMESNKVEAAGFVHAGVQIGAEQHSVETMAETKVKKNGAKLKVLQK